MQTKDSTRIVLAADYSAIFKLIARLAEKYEPDFSVGSPRGKHEGFAVVDAEGAEVCVCAGLDEADMIARLLSAAIPIDGDAP